MREDITAQARQDRYAGWSAEQRMTEFAQTGDSRYLTPEIARRMDVTLHEDGTFSMNDNDTDYDALFLQNLGIDITVIRALPSIRQRLEKLLPLATQFITDHRSKAADVREIICNELEHYTDEDPQWIEELFDSLNPTTLACLHTLEFIQIAWDKLFAELKNRSDLLAHFQDTAARTQKRLQETQNGHIYFVDTAVQDFLKRVAFVIDSRNTRHIEPLEIETGRYAVFADDGDRVYIATTEQSQVMATLLSKHQLLDGKFDQLWSDVLDSGDQLSDEYAAEFKDTPERLHDYLTLLDSRTRLHIEKVLGVELKQLKIREQLALLDYTKTVTVENFKQVQEFAQTYGLNGLRTFLVTAQDEQLRANVLAMPDQMLEIREVLAAYAAYLDTLYEIPRTLESTFKHIPSADTQPLIEQIDSDVRDRAKKILREGITRSSDGAHIRKYLVSLNAHAYLFTRISKQLRKRDLLSLREVANGSVETASGNTLAEKDRRLMRAIWKARYAGKYPQIVEASLLQDLDKALASPDSTFYTYRYRGQLISFLRFDLQSNGARKLASVMTSGEFAGGGICEALLATALDEQGDRADIIAECDPELVQFYGRIGFAVTHMDKDDSVPTAHIRRAAGRTATRTTG